MGLQAPHKFQQQCLSEARRFNVLQCGRRFGKTILGEHIGGTVAGAGWPVGWFAPTYKYLADPWRDLNRSLAPWIAKSNAQERRIELTTGGLIDFWSLEDHDAGRGRKYKLVVVDEYSLVRGLLDWWYHAGRATLADQAGDAWFLGTPKGRGEAHQLYVKGQGAEKEWKSWRFITADNPYISAEEIEAARAEMPEAAFRQEFEGIPADDGANPFGLDHIAACIMAMSDSPAVAFGIDLARKQDWLVVRGIDENGRPCHFSRWQHEPWNVSYDRMERIIGDTPTLVDYTGIGDVVVEELQRRCPNVDGYTFTGPAKQKLMEGLVLAVHNREVGILEGVERHEMESFGYEYKAGGRVSYSAPENMHDDTVCALALARERARTFVAAGVSLIGGGKPGGRIADVAPDCPTCREPMSLEPHGYECKPCSTAETASGYYQRRRDEWMSEIL